MSLSLNPSRFLTLPFELRALIIEHVLFTPLSPPAIAPFQSGGYDFKDLGYKIWSGAPCNLKTYYRSQSMSACSSDLPLLLTNRQVSAETQMILGGIKIDYVLDILVKDDSTLVQTWLSVPCLTTHISTLYANVRLFGHIVEKHVARKRIAMGARLGILRSFYSALEQLLRDGAAARKSHKDGPHSGLSNAKDFADRGILIDTLVLDFQSAELDLAFPPESVTYTHWTKRHLGRDHRDQSETSETLSSYTTRPEWLCERLQGWINSLLHMGYHTSRWGSPLYERIGTIRMLVDGQLHCEFDLAARLAGLQFTDSRSTMGHLPRDDRESGFWKWKIETSLLREAQGFPVKQLSSNEMGRRKIDEPTN